MTRDERSYTFSTNLTKVAGKHEIRSGFDFVRLGLDHWQPEIDNPRGTVQLRRRHHRHPWLRASAAGTSYAAFLLGQMGSFGKSVQFEEMTAARTSIGLYVNDRWQVNDKLTVNAGLRYENYPLMTRADRGIEQLDLEHVQRAARRPRRQRGGPRHQDAARPCSRRASARPTASTTTRCSVPATAARSTRCRGRVRCAASTRSRSRYSGAGPNGFIPYGTLAPGIPGAPNPDMASGNMPLPRGVDMR